MRTWYLVDTNLLAKLSESQRSSEFMKQHCRIPSEVLWEAQGLRDQDVLMLLKYETTTEVLDSLRKVMAAVTVEEKLVDLYSNTGNGDALLLAVAITEKHRADELLFGDDWVIATDDEGLIRKAAEFSVSVCRSAEFIKLIVCPPSDPA